MEDNPSQSVGLNNIVRSGTLVYYVKPLHVMQAFHMGDGSSSGCSISNLGAC